MFLETYSGWIDLIANLFAIATPILGFLAWVFFKRSKLVMGEKYTLELERDDLRKQLNTLDNRLDLHDPDRFLRKVEALYKKGDYEEVEKEAMYFTNRQSEAFGKAAEYLAEQRIIDSDTGGLEAAEEARRFAQIGLAAQPQSQRLAELLDMAARREEGVRKGEPIEALNMDGMTDVELNHLANALLKDGKYALAEIAARRSVPLAVQRTGLQSSNAAAAIGTHGRTLEALSDYAEAERLHREALEINRVALGKAHPQYAVVLSNLANAVRSQGRYAEAEALFRDTLEIGRATVGEAHPDYAMGLNNLAGVVKAQGRYQEAEGLYREALEVDRAALGEAHPDYAIHLNNLAGVVQAQGRFAEAEGLYREALEIDRATIGEAHPSYAIRLGNLGDLLGKMGQVAEGREMLTQALEIFRASLPPEHPNIAEIERRLDALPPD